MEENKDLNVPEGNGDNISFDYNQLYQNAQENIQPQPEQQAVQANPVMEETPIVLGNEQQVEPAPVVKDIVPTFDTLNVCLISAFPILISLYFGASIPFIAELL